jgi:hypothetical protein
MRKNSFYISFGIWIAIIPFFGIPGSWKDVLVSLSGIFLILVFLGPTILKKLQLKPKITKSKSSKIVSQTTLSQDAAVPNISNEDHNQIETEKEIL